MSATSESNTIAACDEAITLLREIADLQTDEDGEVIVAAVAYDQNDLLSRITLFLADHEQ